MKNWFKLVMSRCFEIIFMHWSASTQDRVYFSRQYFICTVLVYDEPHSLPHQICATLTARAVATNREQGNLRCKCVTWHAVTPPYNASTDMHTNALHSWGSWSDNAMSWPLKNSEGHPTVCETWPEEKQDWLNKHKFIVSSSMGYPTNHCLYTVIQYTVLYTQYWNINIEFKDYMWVF